MKKLLILNFSLFLTCLVSVGTVSSFVEKDAGNNTLTYKTLTKNVGVRKAKEVTTLASYYVGLQSGSSDNRLDKRTSSPDGKFSWNPKSKGIENSSKNWLFDSNSANKYTLTITIVKSAEQAVTNISIPQIKTFNSNGFNWTVSLPNGTTLLSDSHGNSQFFQSDFNITDPFSTVGHQSIIIKYVVAKPSTNDVANIYQMAKESYMTYSGYAADIITLNYNNGSTDTGLVYYDEGAFTSTATVPTRDNHTFLGYYDSATGGTQYYDANGALTAGVKPYVENLYAQWEANGTLITLDRQGGITGDTSVIGVYGEALPSAIMPTRPGYTFNGYYSETEGKGTKYYNADGTSATNWATYDATATLYASWTIKEEVQAVIDAINNIENPVELSETCKAHIDAARSAYDALDEFDQPGVSNYSILSSAEARYAELVAAKTAADEVVAKIDSIGEVKYTDSKGAIADARTSYDNLNDDAKGFVTNLDTLVAAENTYNALRDEAVNNVISLIEAIGEVSYPESNDALKAVEAAYNVLDDNDKNLVTNYSTYTETKNSFEALRQEAINNFKNSVNAIGEVSYPQSGPKIKAAEDAYAALLEEDKANVSDYYGQLMAARLNYDTQMQDGIDYVRSLINAIGEVTLDSKPQIDAAKDAYNKLYEEQKEQLTSEYSTLLAKSGRYYELVEAKDEAEEVEAKIEAIGEVSYPESDDAIKEARKAYDALNNDGKNFVSNLDTLEAAESRYDELREVDVNKVEGLISAIGEVQYNETSKGKIDEARKAYDALNADQKALVENYETLVAAETTYIHVDNVAKKIEAIGEVTLDSEEAINEAKSAYDSLSESEKALISSHQEKLVAKEEAYNKLVNNRKTTITLSIVFGVIGGLLVVIAICYILMMFVFNKWINKDGKAVRGFKLGKKENKVRLLVMPFKFEYREESEVFEDMKDAVK